MRGLLASVVCAVAIGIVGTYLLVAWFGSLEVPR